ncbi:hypothetical protein EUGRSUZ_F04019 [Eucalyptus grandis]|uniref:Uncharacterized protein n=2 Tax=Eucalyptus grandis TaxID=71139 RepID=A0ACC3KP92_EUCGR|nr:hypothetical protein EUGRSUZ_F04019 [Eucalyptus grandis]
MGSTPVFEAKETVRKSKGAGSLCCYCGGPVMVATCDVELLFCFIPISHKVKTKYYCIICSTRFVPA